MYMEDCNIILSDEQQIFISKAIQGNNILVDACIGSGKTTAIQMLCNKMSPDLNILYLTYNRLLKLDAKSKITSENVTVTNYHGFAYTSLKKIGISSGISELIQNFNTIKPTIGNYDVLILDEYQDIDLELAEMLEYIKKSCPDIQIIAVGDMNQKIYDKTTLNVSDFINKFLDNYVYLEFTKCFRLSKNIAETLGRIWEKKIEGVNQNCIVEKLTLAQIIDFLSSQKPENILCLGKREGEMTSVLNELESKYPEKFNKKTVYASIREKDSGVATDPKKTSAIFTTFDSSKGLERPICIVFDFTEKYWNDRINNPQQSYKILRNIFCVAASRGKEHIIFVKSDENLLSEKTISTPVSKNTSFRDVDISQMFDFKYKEDVEKCYSLLDTSPITLSNDSNEIKIKNSDGLIDLSPCIGIYQEATFFKNYDIDKDIDFSLRINTNSKIRKNSNIHLETLDRKILYLTSLETKQNRYNDQVTTPFVTNEEKEQLHNRLSEQFTGNEDVQIKCNIPFLYGDELKETFSALGRIDVIKNGTVYELKYVYELCHEHFLQCACYMIATNSEKGILWNTRKNQAFEIKISDRKSFLDAVSKTVTKGYLSEYKDTCSEEKVAVIDTETTFGNKKVISIGAVIADAKTYKKIDSKYYLITPECFENAMFSFALYLEDPSMECDRKSAVSDLIKFLNAYNVKSLYAYNASFDRNQLPELHSFNWYDIMKVAALKQYNRTITDEFDCTAKGKLKSGYGVEPTLQRLLNNYSYHERHNALMDALDELKIMELLAQPLDVYQNIAMISSKVINNGILYKDTNPQYDGATQKISENTFKSYRAADLLKSPRGRNDSENGIVTCENNILDLKNKEELRIKNERILAAQKEKRQRKLKRISRTLIILLVSALVVGLVLFVSIKVILPNMKYKSAINDIEKDNLEDAYTALMELDDYKDSKEQLYKLSNSHPEILQVGDSIFFGKYYQKNSIEKDRIEWTILEKDNDKALVLSKYCLDSQPFSNIVTDDNWEKSSLRKWLNGDFYDCAFSEENEKNSVILSIESEALNDKIFLLSEDEVYRYLPIESDRVGYVTSYATTKGVQLKENRSCWWWLRDSDGTSLHAKVVSFDGKISENGLFVTDNDNAVRPAMWIDLKSISKISQ